MRELRRSRSGLRNLSDKARIAVSSFYLTVTSVLVAVLSVACIHLTAQRLGGEGYGHFATIIAIVTMLALFADLGITSVTSRNIAAFPEKAGVLVGDALAVRLILCAILAPCLIGGAYFLYPHARGTVVLGIGLMSIDLFFASTQAVAQAYFSAQLRNGTPSLILLGSKSVYLLLTALGVVLTRNVIYFVGAYVFADACAAIASLLRLRRVLNLRPMFRPRNWWPTLHTGAALGAMQVTNRLYSRLDTFILSILKPASEVATYGIAFNFTDVIVSFPSYIMASVLPLLVRTDDIGRVARGLQASYDVVIWLAAPIAVGGFLLRHQIVLLVAGPGYGSAAAPLGILVISLCVSFPQVVFVWGCLAVGKYRLLFPAIVLVTTVNAGANLALIPKYGPKGSAVAQLATESLSLIVTYCVFRYESGIRINIWRPWRVAFVAGLLIPFSYIVRDTWQTGSALANPFIGALIMGLFYFAGTALTKSLPVDTRGWLSGMNSRLRDSGSSSLE